MQFLDFGGVALHYRHQPGEPGQPVLVFINSLGTDFRIWEEVADNLGANFPILCYDKRGHGLSGLGTPPYSIEDHAADLAALIAHVGAAEVILCGLSIGGLIAQAYAAARPQGLKALILCDTAHKIGTDAGWNQRIARVERDGIEPIADGILELWFTPAFRANRRAELAGCRNMLVRQPIAGYAGSCAAVRDADLTDAIAAIAVPTLVVAGDQDGSTPPDLVRATAERIPGARFEIIPDAGHIPCVEQPADLVARIRRFLAEESLLP
jgi:3-oxoadipate enol-lactonase